MFIFFFLVKLLLESTQPSQQGCNAQWKLSRYVCMVPTDFARSAPNRTLSRHSSTIIADAVLRFIHLFVHFWRRVVRSVGTRWQDRHAPFFSGARSETYWGVHCRLGSTTGPRPILATSDVDAPWYYIFLRQKLLLWPQLFLNFNVSILPLRSATSPNIGRVAGEVGEEERRERETHGREGRKWSCMQGEPWWSRTQRCLFFFFFFFFILFGREHCFSRQSRCSIKDYLNLRSEKKMWETRFSTFVNNLNSTKK